MTRNTAARTSKPRFARNALPRASALILTAGTAALLLGACATVKGVGRDIESVGQAGQDAID